MYPIHCIALHYVYPLCWSIVFSHSSYDSLLPYTSKIIQTNTFQGILATNFVRSFAVFTYLCGDLSYSADTVIGVDFDDGSYVIHPASDDGIQRQLLV